MPRDQITTNESVDYYAQYSDDHSKFFMMFGEVSCKFSNLEFVTRLVLERLATPHCLTIAAILTNDNTISDRLKMIRKLSEFRYVKKEHEALLQRFDQFTRSVRSVIEERNQYVHCNWNAGTGAADDLRKGQIYRSNYRDQWRKKAITVIQKGQPIPEPSGTKCVTFEEITALSRRLQSLIDEADSLIRSMINEPGMQIGDPSIPFTHTATNDNPKAYPTRMAYRPNAE